MSSPHKPGRKRVLASKAGYGFILPEDEAMAFRRAGKQVLNVARRAVSAWRPAATTWR